MYTEIILENTNPIIIEQILEDSIYNACINDMRLCESFLEYADLLEHPEYEPSEEFHNYMDEVIYPYFETASAIYGNMLFEVFADYKDGETYGDREVRLKKANERSDAKHVGEKEKRPGGKLGLFKKIAKKAGTIAGGLTGTAVAAPAGVVGAPIGAALGAYGGKKHGVPKLKDINNPKAELHKSALKGAAYGALGGAIAPASIAGAIAARVGHKIGSGIAGVANKIRKGVNRAKHAIDVKRANVTGKAGLGAKLFGFKDNKKTGATAANRVKRVQRKEQLRKILTGKPKS